MPKFRARGSIRIDVEASNTKEAGEKALEIAREMTSTTQRIDLRAIGPNVILERLL